MESLGDFLKDGRKEAGLSLEELAQRTRIRIENLDALEREDLDSLPTDIYVRGFVKLACRELGLAPEDGLVRYESLRSTSGPHDEIISSEEREVSEPGWLERVLKDPERVVRTLTSAVKWGGLGLGGVLVLVAVVAGVKTFQGGGEPSTPPPDVAAREIAKPEPAKPEPVKPEPVKPESRKVETKKLEPEKPEPTRAELQVEKPKEQPAAEPKPELALVEPVIPERRPPGTVEAGDPVAEAARAAEAEARVAEADATPAPAPAPAKEVPTPTVVKIDPPPEPRVTPGIRGPRVRSGDRLVLEVEALRPVEVEVLLDGIGRPRSKLLSAGEKKTWKADSLFLLSATDGGALRLSLQGVDLGIPGRDGEPMVQARVRPR